MPSVDGIVSGLDTSGIIDGLVSAASVPKETYELQLANAESKLEKVGEFKTKLSTLMDTLEDMNETSSFGEFTASLGEEGYFTAEVGSEAIAGAYEIEVTTLAKAEMEVTQGFADKSSTGEIAEGTFDVTYNGDTTTVTVDSSNSSLTLVAKELDDIDGVRAFVLDTGDATTPYKLVVMGEDTGEDYSLSFDTANLTGAGTVPTFTEQVTASNAAATVNGIAVSGESNALSDALPGLDLTLTQLTTDPVTITISRDDEAITEKIEGFVEAFNDLNSFYKVNTNFDSDEGIKGALFGDSAIRSIMNTLSAELGKDYGTYEWTGDSADLLPGDLTSLGLIGINTLQSGKLEVDSTVLDEAITDNYDDVVALFTADGGASARLVDLMDSLYLADDGTIDARTETLEDTVSELEDTIEDFEERMESYEERLRAQFTAMEVTLGQLQNTQSFLGSLLTSTTSSSSS